MLRIADFSGNLAKPPHVADEFAVGHYIGETDIVGTALRAERSYAPANRNRLQLLRAKYDPDGLFLGHFR
jgi:hypothetical protein